MPIQFTPGMDALHHSRLLTYRMPQGAVPKGETVTLRLDAAPRFERALLRLWVAGEEKIIPMQRQAGEYGWRYEARAQMPDVPGLCWYFFVLEAEGGFLCYGGDSGIGALYPHEPPGYQITVYEPDFTTPRWYREGILYQIFPDRFARLEPPERGMEYHRALGRRVRYHEDWTQEPCYLPEPGEAHYAPDDFFGGSLSGILEKLPYLADLGVTCLYLNPVFESASNHRYDTADYRNVDPILGDNEDLALLCREAGALGIRVMLDGVFSHTGDDSLYFDRYQRYGDMGAYHNENSPYRQWYCFSDEYPKTGYRCWWGFPKLPEVDETAKSYRTFVYEGEDSLIDIWAKAGVTSWRLDVADELPDEFIAGIRTKLKELDPDSVLLGEVWEDASTKEAYGVRRQYVFGRVLDSVMNYPFQNAVLDFFINNTDAYALDEVLQRLRERYPKPFWYAAMNLLSTHDSVRAITFLGGAPHRAALSREEQAGFALTPEAEALGKRRLRLAAALQMALPGVPSIYYGDEAGVTGMVDPFNRRTYPWGHEDQALLDDYRKLCRARTQSAALKAGFCRMGALSPDVYAVLRFTGETDAFFNPAEPQTALLLINRGEAEWAGHIGPKALPEGPDGMRLMSFAGDWKDAISGDGALGTEEGLDVVIPPLGAQLLLR